MTETTKSDAQTVRALATVADGIKVPGIDDDMGRPMMVVPEGYRVEDVEKFLLYPISTQRNVTLLDLDSFIRYVNTFKVSGTMIIANPKELDMKAVIDYPTADQPKWGKHVAGYSCPVSKEWTAWSGSNKAAKTQGDFTQFIENNLPDIVQDVDADGNLIGPTAADMLEVSRSMEAKKSVEFKSATRLDNGAVQFTYNEDVAGTTRGGSMQIPEEFYIGIPIFQGGDRYRIKARLRYRLKDGHLAMWYDLHREDRSRDAAFQDVIEKIEKATAIKPLMGVL